MSTSAHELLQVVLKADRARILSSLIRTCGGDFDLAEEALHDAVVAATMQWPRGGIPDAPEAWLLQTARHKAIDSMRAYTKSSLTRPTPVVALNHAVAVSMAYGAEEGLRLLAPLADDLDGYGPFHAARADFCRTLGRREEAELAYRRAIELATNDPERRFLEGRLREVQGMSILRAK